MSCIDLALDPNDAGHFILVRITGGLHVWETTDAGASFHSLDKNSIYHIGIDRQGWLYTAVRPLSYTPRGGVAHTPGRMYPCGSGFEAPLQGIWGKVYPCGSFFQDLTARHMCHPSPEGVR